jgi:hypothetical protein
MDEHKESPLQHPEPDYDMMSEEEYMKEMEQKVEYYKKHYPDMYEKAEQWLKMLEHSEIYKKETGDTSGDASLLLKAKDILKNVQFHGLDESDLTESELSLLQEHIPQWKEQL